MRLIVTSILTIVLAVPSIWAQKSARDNEFDSNLRKATELFEKQKYVAAASLFREIAESPIAGGNLNQLQASYYEALCALYLYNNDAELLSIKFMTSYPESPLVNNIRLQLSNHFYFRKSYRDAIETYAKLEKSQLTEDEKAEFYFKSGYSWYMLDSLDKARKAFSEIKDIDTKYTSPALYYYSHIAYTRQQYETALEGFKRLEEDETFAPIVPYYISQCYYLQGKYGELIAYGTPLIDSVVESRVAEMAHMIADAHYRQNQYKEAIPYFELYFEKALEKKSDDYFQLGLCYFKTGAYEKAIPMFEKVSVNESATGQYAAYYLAGCHIQFKNKPDAQKAFYSAASMDYDTVIKEDAMFQNAILTYELSNSPFNDALKALNDYLEAYPKSRRSEEAYQYLVAVYMNTRNYKEALVYIEKITIRDKNIRYAYQRAAFFHGLELFNNLELKASLEYFDKSLRYAEGDPRIAARAYYWSAEASFRMGDFSSAITNYNLFIASPVAEQCPEYRMASYNLGYCYFNKKEYTTSQPWFDKSIALNIIDKSPVLANAYNRRGDCSFIQMKYQEAIDFYSLSITIGLSDKDYAMFQKAFCLGLLGKHNEKIVLLRLLIATDIKSSYTDAAWFEMGRSYSALQQNDKALTCYQTIQQKYKSGIYSGKALLNTGLIHYNEGRNIQALETYKQVVAEYPGTPEARSALTGIKNVYIELNEVDAYIEYAGKVGGWALMGQATQDSLSFQSAENLYMAGDCKKSLEGLNKYLTKYPDGIFSIEAHFYQADCLLKNKKTDDAVASLLFVADQPINVFTEQALMRLASIYAERKDQTNALKTYKQLDTIATLPQNMLLAQYQVMAIQNSTNNLAEASLMADKLLKEPSLPQEYERLARLIKGKNLLAQNQNEMALAEFKRVAADLRNAEGAEAEYLYCQTLNKTGKQAKAQEEIFKFIELNSPHQFWLAKAFILLADIYQAQKDEYQAVSTLQSIVDNYTIKDDGIIKEANDKLLRVKGNYSSSDSIKQKDDLQIKLKK